MTARLAEVLVGLLPAGVELRREILAGRERPARNDQCRQQESGCGQGTNVSAPPLPSR